MRIGFGFFSRGKKPVLLCSTVFSFSFCHPFQQQQLPPMRSWQKSYRSRTSSTHHCLFTRERNGLERNGMERNHRFTFWCHSMSRQTCLRKVLSLAHEISQAYVCFTATRDKLKKRTVRSDSNILMQAHRQMRNKVDKLITESKREYFSNKDHFA